MAGYSDYYGYKRRSPRDRRARPRDGRTVDTGDAIVSAITIQVVICVMLILVFVVYKKVQEESYHKIKVEYTDMTTNPEGSQELVTLLSGATQGISDAWKGLEAMVAELLSGLFGGDTTLQEPVQEAEAEPQGENVAAPELPAGSVIPRYDYLNPPGNEEMDLSGAGGWFPVKKKSEEAPSGSTFSPVIVGGYVQPPVTGRITSGFGYRDHPVTETEDFHNGMDIAALEGHPILAALPGTVLEVGESQIYGNYIVLEHAYNLKTSYAHCSEIIAGEGTVVRQGERIAKVGETGITTGPHLHFSLIIEDQYADPYWVLKNDIRVLE